MVQILQQGPSEATLRQQALNEAYQNIISGASGVEKAQTLRQQALLAKQEKADTIKRDQEKADIANMIALSKEGIAPEMLRPALEQLKTGKYEKQVISPAIEAVPSFGGFPALMGEKEQVGPIRPEQSMAPKELAGPTLTGQPLMSREMQGPPKPAIQLGKVPYEMRAAIPETEAIPGKEAVYAPSPLQTYSEAKKQKMAEEKQKMEYEKSGIELRNAQADFLRGRSPLVQDKMQAEIEKIKSDAALSPIKKRQLEADIAKKYADIAKLTKENKSGKMMSAKDVANFNEGNQIPKTLEDTRAIINANADIFGPISGRKAEYNPWDVKGQTIDSAMRSASQSFGRFMEGGVLRKEDEEKYRKMFPKLSDTPDVAKNKIDLVNRLLVEKQQGTIEALKKSGYDISGIEKTLVQSAIPGILKTQSQGPQGNTVVQNGVTFTWNGTKYVKAGK